ncbi:MAG: IPT/TIG domain-containing protein, partial [Thermoanaerobaculia bacterium]
SATLPAAAAPVAAPAPAAPQTLGVSFRGARLADTNAFPPDSSGAAGPTQFLVGVNGRIRTFAKSTGLADGVLNADMDTFFNSVRGGNPTAIPRVRFDRLSSRWIVTISNFAASFVNNRILVAVSDAASNGILTSGTVWTYFFFQHNLVSPAGDTDLFFDSPTLGVDANALLIGGNVFDSAGAFQGTTVHVVRKSALLSGPGGNLVPGKVVAFRSLTNLPTGPGPYAPQGVDDPNGASLTESWLAGVDNASFGTLMLRKISYTALDAWPPIGISANLALPVPSTALPLTVPHQGNTGGTDGELDAVDDRLGSMLRRGNRLWTAHNIAVTASGTGSPSGTRDGSRWYEIDVAGSTPSLAQSGTLFDASAVNPSFYWIPSIAVSGQGHAALATSVAGAARRIDGATAGRLAGDPPGTLQSPLAFTSSADAYNPPADPGPPRRWGDYSHTSVDPNDDMTMWTIQEYCDAADSYGVRVVELVAPPPPPPSAATPPSVDSGLASILVDITGTSSGGSGFFDPGAGFPDRLQASVSGGVGVNSLTYTSPTSITLDLNTVGAATGPRTVTVTNPDGQLVTSSSGLLTIGTPGAPTITTITPASGPAVGGTAFTLTGTGFVPGATISIGGTPATGVNVGSDTSASGITPALSPGKLNDVTVQNPDTLSGTLFSAFLSDFLDVPQADIFHASVETLFRRGVTAGCGLGNYCRDAFVTRAQVAVFLLKAKLGAGYAPPACTGTVFGDVPCTGGIFDPWIEDLAARGITGGCGGGNYCPGAAVSRAQMAPLLLKTDLGSSYAPPACTGTVFGDVPCTGGIFDAWIEDLAARGITGGCSAAPPLYCPSNPNRRGQMAVFLVITFGL